MRQLKLLSVLLAVVAVGTAAAPARARLFWQTYGATVATAEGCSWNMSMDYFVPRTCDSCRYDLNSACKSQHGISPACRSLHPIYSGYCTPYGACHYKRRDHVYAKHCGCTPLACTYGPWKLAKCHKHCRRTPDTASCCGGCGMTPLVDSTCGCASPAGCCETWSGSGDYPRVASDDFAYLPNVEPFGVAVLGTVAAFPSRSGGPGMGGAMPMAGAAAMPGMIPGMPQSTPAAGGAGGGGVSPSF